MCIGVSMVTRYIGDPEAIMQLFMNVLQLNITSSQTVPVKIVGNKVDEENVNIVIETSLGANTGIEYKLIKKIVNGVF